MTTTPRKNNNHKKARAISSGFLELINTFVLNPRQGLAHKRRLFRSLVKNHTEDNSITVCDIASVLVENLRQYGFFSVTKQEVCDALLPTPHSGL